MFAAHIVCVKDKITKKKNNYPGQFENVKMIDINSLSYTELMKTHF